MRRVGSLVLVLISFSCLSAQAQQSMSDGHPGHEMSMTNTPLDPAAQAKLLADKKESQFNHHLAGFFVALGGGIILFQSPLGKRFPLVKYIWPASFLLSGVFVLVWSDTELWPFGGRHWLEALQNNREVLQHKTYAVLLLALGLIEWLRVKGTLRAAWSGMVFPLLAIGGSVLLLFHQHEAGMSGPNHMEVMARIQSEHLSYAVVGMGIGLVKGLYEIRMRGYHFLARVWPVLMVALGILLMSYRE
jgi:copper resistance protein D